MSSGSSEPSMWMWSSALGSRVTSAVNASGEGEREVMAMEGCVRLPRLAPIEGDARRTSSETVHSPHASDEPEVAGAMSGDRRLPHLRRTWLFGPGADAAAHGAMTESGADVCIQDLEDFTPPARRAEAR